MVTLLWIVFVVYALLLAGMTITVYRTFRNNANLSTGAPRLLSIVVAFRNEEKHIQNLVSQLAHQNYPADYFEVILVDDHSTDKSLSLARACSRDLSNFKVIPLDSTQGKKAALNRGISLAQAEIIVTTDTDCVRSSEWLMSIDQGFPDEVNMLIGPVNIAEDAGFFSQLQALEFTSLQSTTTATSAWRFPVLCNGANLAFRKKIFEAVGGYSGNEHIASGDDEFLMRKIQKKFPGSVRFLAHEDAIVNTGAKTSLSELVNQRVRWAGKWRFNHFMVKGLAVFIVVVHVSFLASISLYAAGHLPLPQFGFIVVSKCGLEFLLLKRTAAFLGCRWRWYHFAAMQFLYPIYVILVGFLSLWVDYEWKGRSLPHSMPQNS